MGKRILVTGARAPATLEAIRRLARAGHAVFAADSLRFPLSRGSRFLTKAFLVSSPRWQPGRFAEELGRIIRRERIDFLLPTCEEVYYIARFRSELPPECEVFCPPFEMLNALHNKWTFAQQTEALGGEVRAPQSFLVETASHLAALAKSSREWVFKPVYSRFAAQTLIRPEAAQLAKLPLDPANPWMAQKFVDGQELSSYSIVRDGRMRAHALYRSRYRAGQASGFYFIAEEDQSIFRFVESLAARLKLTGQIAFDFIRERNGGVSVLECNPRLTSGIHLFPDEFELNRSLWGSDGEPERVAAGASPKMLGFAMFLYGGGYLRRGVPFRKLAADFSAARDVIFAASDPAVAWYQALSFAEILVRSMSRQVPLTEAATADIEWNGQPIV